MVMNVVPSLWAAVTACVPYPASCQELIWLRKPILHQKVRRALSQLSVSGLCPDALPRKLYEPMVVSFVAVQQPCLCLHRGSAAPVVGAEEGAFMVVGKEGSLGVSPPLLMRPEVRRARFVPTQFRSHVYSDIDDL